MNPKRSAEDTIKGFNYQFAATVLLILEAKDGTEITIEGIEDVDVSGNSVTEAIQCKYYEGSKLTNSVLRDIVKPMLEDDKGRTSKIDYYIYGHFKDQATFPLNDPSRFRDEVLCYTTGKGPDLKKGNVADDIGCSTTEIGSFLGRLKLRYTQDYETHKRKVQATLQKHFGCNPTEVTHFHYPFAFSKVAEIATKATPAERKISKAAFLKSFEAKQIVFKHWLLHEKGEADFCQAMRRTFFSSMNISPTARFFVIDCDGNETLVELKSTAITLRNKWSSHKASSKKVPKERYAPYLLFRNAAASAVLALHRELYLENTKFVDGFPFKGANFSIPHISQPQTYENGISLRFVHETGELDQLLAGLPNESKEIFEFYRTNPSPLNGQIRHVQIPIRNLSSINQII